MVLLYPNQSAHIIDQIRESDAHNSQLEILYMYDDS